MKRILKLLFISIMMSLASVDYADTTKEMTPQQKKEWIKEALHYGFNMSTTDYTRYMSENYLEHIDGKTFNFEQWLHHMTGIKKLMKSYELRFNEIVVEGENIAASYDVQATKINGEKLVIRVIAIFKIKDGKMVYCDELTHLLEGSDLDKHLSDKN